MLENVIPFLTSSLGNPEVSPSATMALKDLTHNCQKYLVPFSSHILHACQVKYHHYYHVCFIHSFSHVLCVFFQSALQSGLLKLGECIRIMYSIGKVLSIIPVANIMEYLNVILTPYFEEIQMLLSVEQVLVLLVISIPTCVIIYG